MSTESTTLGKKDFQSDQEVRWCPGCGDYAILSAVQTVFPKLGIPRERFVVVSGIGCSSRFPYYMNTFGFHSIHGRAPAIASGLKASRPDLEVWVATGDGDALSIGGNHLIHVLRRNLGVKIVMFNNRIYGLTKGQYSPTSEFGKRTKSTPDGSIDTPFNPIALAIGASATFVARTVDIFQTHMREVLERAGEHRGAAFVEVYQNCNIFNDKAFTYMTEKEHRDDAVLYLEHGKPLLFGTGKTKGIALRDTGLAVIEVPDPAIPPADCLIWDETNETLSFLLAHMLPPEFPTPIGIFHIVESQPYEAALVAQIEHAIDRRGAGTLEDLIYSGEIWAVAEDGTITRGATVGDAAE